MWIVASRSLGVAVLTGLQHPLGQKRVFWDIQCALLAGPCGYLSPYVLGVLNASQRKTKS